MCQVLLIYAICGLKIPRSVTGEVRGALPNQRTLEKICIQRLRNIYLHWVFSLIKELLENAIDASAVLISVENSPDCVML
ncbi:hypothetical protein BGX38DRAFT_97842 [Terfezia claveryi]|nr:hypothetical protein BGX38DRAFT_97842 [Terfezia claveryi]